MSNPVVYSDESGFSQDMPRRYGGSRRGHKGRISVIGALPGNQLLNVGSFQGNINTNVFHSWLTQELLHQAPAKAVFVMDNASFHKRQDIQEAIRNAGFTPEYLPTYSPDLNPTEHKRAQAKALRKKRRCDVDTLFSSELF